MLDNNNAAINSDATKDLVECPHCGQLVDPSGLVTVHTALDDAEKWCEDCAIAEGMHQCENCGDYFDPSLLDIVKDEFGCEMEMCPECIESRDDIHYCDHCERYYIGDTYSVMHRSASRWRYVEEEWCEDCCDNDAIQCNDCEQYFYDDGVSITEIHTWNDEYVHVCSNCYDDNWYCCHDCGRYVHADDVVYSERTDNNYCPDCYDEYHRRSDNLESYGHTSGMYFWLDDGSMVPEWKRGNVSLFLGIELETSDNYDRNELADNIIDEFGWDKFSCKEDCSIGDDGVEIVSQPMTPLYHLNSGVWEKVFEFVHRQHGCSHDGGRCGLHIHISRDFFKSHDAVYRLDRLFTRHRDNFVKFSRRSSSSLGEWCSIDADDSLAKIADVDERKQAWYSKKNRSYRARYQAVNDTCPNTVEIRLWRGTLNPQTFRATVEMTAGLAIICNTMGDKLADQLNWNMTKTLVKYALEANGIPHDDLDAYLKERGL